MRRRTYGVVVVAAAVLASAGCSSKYADDSGSSATAAAGNRAVEPVTGCGTSSWTDPADLSPTRTPARCKPLTPARQPLPKTTKLTIATGTLSAEYVAPLEVALDKGEFKKEGLDVTLKVLPTPDALPLLAKGDIDAMWAAPEAAVMNGVKDGFDIKWVAGNFSPDPKSKSGLWVKLKKGEAAADVRMAGRRMGTMIGKGSVSAYPMEKALATHGGGLDKIQYQQLGSADVLTALQNGGVDSAWLLDPVWRKVDDNPAYAFLGGQPLGEPLGGMLYGRSLLHDHVDAGVALLRAYIRTVNTYFAGDYKNDPAFTMDWEIRAGTTTRLQAAYDEAVGHQP
ncbi:NitT/TauT family transport system substrate-binding protein [Streptomyces sp. 3213]|uniref:ABC transporter substrate-binding protein n=1 Tax=Streptomyces sp. 3213.3 TaxID=1855348 RepID=UPI000897B4B7|nr:ABC transporter substrate-binding protein [Streptomyces sp. 3213.3]SEE45042.1 NitT/TauT family transport system substrate-binding protein [Streptomyces sp. 3213] [Streptomyces sp. 3213.3]